MPRGPEAQRKYNIHRSIKRQEKARAKEARRERKRMARNLQRMKDAAKHPPVITEADLLAFQLSHFGDDTSPDEWFVDAQLAIEYDPLDDDDGLGYYEDGVKRTLTDEQIEMFRHTEMEEIARAERLAREERGEEGAEQAVDDEEIADMDMEQRAPSPFSDVSSMDEDLVGLAKAVAVPKNLASPSPAATSIATTTTATTTTSAASSDPPTAFATTNRSLAPPPRRSSSFTENSVKLKKEKKKQRKEEIPYEERNKRKWEEHIASVEPVKGTWLYESKTENRMLREMDDVKAESVEMDY